MGNASSRLWAPWRSGFVMQPKPRGCFLCAAGRSRDDRRHHIVARGRNSLALLNRYPYNNGHVLIAPRRHTGRLETLRPEEWADMLTLATRIMGRLRRALHPQGFNFGANLGRMAGAGVPGHLHLHLVPRWAGDTNFMPVLGDTKVISQSLDDVHAALIARPRRAR